MSLISFLNAVGPRIGDLDLGDLAHLESIDDAKRYYVITDEFSSSGIKHRIPIPSGQKFILVSAAVVPANAASTRSYCYVDLKFGDQRFDRMFYDYTQDSTTKIREATYSHFLTGDGIRNIEIDVDSISDVAAQVILIGYYKDREITSSQAVRNLVAEELSPDDIRLTWDAPLDTGGLPIIGYRIRRGDTLDDDGNVENFVTLESLYEPDSSIEAGITFDDIDLADNTTYYYDVIPITGTIEDEIFGADSEIISATTEIDHPAVPTDITSSKQSSSHIRLAWTAPTDTGGVPLQGYQIQRSASPTFGFADIVSNTNNQNTTYDDTELSPGTYYYRLKAINEDGKSSLIFSDVASLFITYDAPTNLRHELSSDSKNALLEWDEPVDIADRTVQGYKVDRSADDENFSTLIEDTQSRRTGYTDDTIDGNIVYYYRVSIVINDIVGPPSESIRVNVPVRPPSRPQNLILQTISDTQVGISWDPPVDNGGLPITGYKLQRSKSFAFPNAMPGGITHAEEVIHTTPIPIDGSATVEDTITIDPGESANIGAVQVSVNIAHTWRGDLLITLIAPNGESFTLQNVDLHDNGDDVIETYSGDIFNDLIGLSSEGDWTLKIRDITAAEDDGMLNGWELHIEPVLEELTEIELGSNIVKYSDTDLESVTQYFYRVRAINNLEGGDYSPTQNTTTFQFLFGDGSDGDLVVPENTRTIIIGQKQYQNIRIENGAVLEASDAIIKCNGDYDEIETGHIETSKTGCPGGIRGMTQGGVGGSSNVTLVFSEPLAPHFGDPSILTEPIPALSCTDFTLAENLIDNIISPVIFDDIFINQLKGGKGSEGTPARLSGDGGDSGDYIESSLTGVYISGGAGGNGGTGAQGADGVRGGGKFAFFVKHIVSTLRINATGNDGNNGNQGTNERGQPGLPGRAFISKTSGAGNPGSKASATGTLASEGSQGGIVYVAYESLSGKQEFLDTFDNSLDGWDFFGIPEHYTAEHSDEHDGSVRIHGNGEGQEVENGIEKIFDLSSRAAEDPVSLSLDWRAISNNFNRNNAQVRVLNADTDESLYEFILQTGGNLDSGWQEHSINITSAISGVDNIKIQLYLREFGSVPDYAQENFYDNVKVLVNIATATMPEVDVSGGMGGLDGASSFADDEFSGTRADSGDEGLAIVEPLSNLLS